MHFLAKFLYKLDFLSKMSFEGTNQKILFYLIHTTVILHNWKCVREPGHNIFAWKHWEVKVVVFEKVPKFLFFRSRTWCKMTFDTYNSVENEKFGHFKIHLHPLSLNYELQIIIWSKVDFQFSTLIFQLWVRPLSTSFSNVNQFLGTIHSIWSK